MMDLSTVCLDQQIGTCLQTNVSTKFCVFSHFVSFVMSFSFSNIYFLFLYKYKQTKTNSQAYKSSILKFSSFGNKKQQDLLLP